MFTVRSEMATIKQCSRSGGATPAGPVKSAEFTNNPLEGMSSSKVFGKNSKRSMTETEVDCRHPTQTIQRMSAFPRSRALFFTAAFETVESIAATPRQCALKTMPNYAQIHSLMKLGLETAVCRQIIDAEASAESNRRTENHRTPRDNQTLLQMAIENPDDIVGDENEEDFVVFMKIPEETTQPEVSIVSEWPGDEQKPAPVEKKIDAEGNGWNAMDCGIKPRVVRPGNGYFRRFKLPNIKPKPVFSPLLWCLPCRKSSVARTSPAEAISQTAIAIRPPIPTRPLTVDRFELILAAMSGLIDVLDELVLQMNNMAKQVKKPSDENAISSVSSPDSNVEPTTESSWESSSYCSSSSTSSKTTTTITALTTMAEYCEQLRNHSTSL